MARINEYFLNFYHQLAFESLSMLNYLSIGSMVIFLLVSLLLGLRIIWYYRFRFKQNEQTFHFATFIPSHVL